MIDIGNRRREFFERHDGEGFNLVLEAVEEQFVDHLELEGADIALISAVPGPRLAALVGFGFEFLNAVTGRISRHAGRTQSVGQCGPTVVGQGFERNIAWIDGRTGANRLPLGLRC